MKCKQDEKALQENEEQYKAIFNNSLDGIFITRPDGTILAANPAACQMFGMTEEELIQAGRDGTVDTSDPRLKYVLEERNKTGRFKGELNHRRKDGTIFPSEISSTLFKDKNGLTKCVMIIRDITARKQAEDALRRSEKQYRMLFTNMTEGFGLVEVIYNNYGRPYDFRYLEVNPAFELYLGVKRDQLLGKTMREIFPNVSPIAIEKYREVALSGQPINFEIFSHVANKYLDIRAFIPEKGKIALILRDISKTKQVEETLHERDALLSAFLEQLPIGVSLFDAQGHYLIKNKIYQRFVGESIPSKDPEISQRWKGWGPDGNLLDKSQWPGARALQGENVTPGIDMLYRLDNGQEIWMRVSAVPFRNEAGDNKGVISIIQDIDDQKRTEEALKKAYDTLEERVKERTEELENAYNSLKGSEKNLAEAQRIAHIGSWEHDLRTSEVHWSDELYRIFGLKPQESKVNYGTFLNSLHPDDRNNMNNAVKESLKRKPLDANFRIIRANGEERIAHAKAEVVFDEKNNPVRIRGTTQDITEHRKAEERLRESEENIATLQRQQTKV